MKVSVVPRAFGVATGIADAGRAALNRNAEVDDITGGALYLASALSSFITGQTLVVDGGKQFI
jgi:enoyl-[acyl-carrier-protein] reductase (NADH)